MKSFITLGLAALVAASPVAPSSDDIVALEAREKAGIERRDITENEFTVYGCRDVIFIFARGSTEVGNMGTVIGPGVCDGLKERYGTFDVACEGVDYPATLAGNFLPGGASYEGIAEMEDLLDDAASQCPNSKIVAGGYSQGAALTHRAVEDRSQATKDKIVGVVTFGDTKNLQDGGRIPNFPREKTKIFCNAGDLVCYGTLTITAAHLTYGLDADDAVDFLASKIGNI